MNEFFIFFFLELCYLILLLYFTLELCYIFIILFYFILEHIYNVFYFLPLGMSIDLFSS